jgi:hypothetical protein
MSMPGNPSVLVCSVIGATLEIRADRICNNRAGNRLVLGSLFV